MDLKTSESLQIDNNQIGFKIIIKNDNTLSVIFNKDFWLHPEAVETIQYFMYKINDKPLSDMLIRSIREWFKGFLDLCFKTNLGSMTYIVGFTKIERNENEKEL